jgi:hypothetical protein
MAFTITGRIQKIWNAFVGFDSNIIDTIPHPFYRRIRDLGWHIAKKEPNDQYDGFRNLV